MAKKQIVEWFEVETAKTLASNFTSTNIFTVKTVDNIGINIDCNNVTDNQGTFAVQHRLYKTDTYASEWATLTLSSTPTLADGDDTFLVSLNQLPPGQVRVKFTAAGGTPDGDCTIRISATSVGG